MKSSALLLALLLSGCAGGRFYMKVGVADNSGNGWNNAGEVGGTAGFGVYYDHADRISSHWYGYHVSQWGAGFPFNDDSESTLNQAGVELVLWMK